MKRFILAALAIISIGVGVAIGANYTATQGSGTTFGSLVVSAVNYAQQLVCDPTTPTQCIAVSAGGAAKVDGSAVTQPISAASLPLPTGASTAAGLTTINTTLGSPFQAGGNIGNTSFAATQATAASLNATVVGTGTFATQAAQSGTWNITNVSGTVSLPTGASTAAKQPALGTAGSASTDVLTVQGIASMTPLLINPGTAANWGVGATAGAVPANAVYMGINSGGNLTGWTGAVTNTGTFAVQATLQASATTAIGKVDPNTLGNWGLVASTQNGTTPTNMQLLAAQFNTSPTTVSNGNVTPLQIDNAGNLLVNIKAGAGSGGTAIADNAAFTQSTTSETPAGCLFNTSYAAATSGHSTVVQCDAQGHPLVGAAEAIVSAGNTLNGVTANTTGTSIPVSGYGSALFNVNCSVNCTGGTVINFQALDVVGTAFPIGIIPVTGASGAISSITNQTGAIQYCAPNLGYTNMRATVASYSAGTITVTITPINANNCDISHVANSNANGSATSANSSPVVIASDQAAVAIKAASGAIASGAIASGAIASGAIASGAAVSGAFVAGSIADLAHGQGTMSASVPVAIASNQSSIPITVASGGIASGAIASGAIASGAFATGSFLNATAGDPCMFQAKTNVAISTASGTTALVAGVSAKKIYVCSMTLIAGATATFSLSEGSSSTCGTSSQAAVMGVATNGTAANGLSLAANGGLTLGNGGGTIAATATAANYLCLFQSGTTQISGNLTYVQQ